MSMQQQGMVPQQIAPQGQPPQQQMPMAGVAGVPNDLVSHVRSLVYELKKCLTNLMVVTASNIVHNSQIDSGARMTETKAARFDKSLEEFFSLCNQIERHLRLISECVIQLRDSNKYIPFNVSHLLDTIGPIEQPIESISNSQFMAVVKHQVKFVQQIQDLLLQGSSRINPHELPSGPGGQPQHPQQQQQQGQSMQQQQQQQQQQQMSQQAMQQQQQKHSLASSS